ncbi:DnaA initiator-associating factor for replication initiation [Haemophilus pittmaniae]|uniref:DnaA initiator-associating factor for replication initiation n=1 Tax=Haemophilus pittmaniae TaxID=249188 RepID=A0A377J1B9_9PAST|nr:SIS domain-containing protein [Haemophilus pittmaniae]STO94058.1 DnaA initiator-associating factor for replication initiation [Haemophilus pittmaniae]
MLQKVKDIYSESIQIQISASSLLSENIANAAQMVMQCLLSGHKVIACGSGRSHANAQLLVANLLNRYDLARPSFPSVLLDLNGAIGNALIFEKARETLYQHQFNAIACPGDLLLAFAPLGSEKTVLNVIENAVEKELRVVALTGANNDTIQGILAAEDLQIAVPATKESRILENHLFVINALCELVDLSLFPCA